MRYAILADIHSNIEALDSVLKNCQQQKIDGIFCAGDIVGYGANPLECLQRLGEVQAICVAGNHDWAVSGRLNASYFTNDGKAALAWTRNKLPLDYVQFFNKLELCYQHSDFEMVHSSPLHPERFSYLDDISKVAQAVGHMKTSVCFIGHTHVPRIYVSHAEQVTFYANNEIDIIPGNKYLVNVGSVGQPRDGNSLASFAIFDTELKTIRIQRQKYDIPAAQAKIISAGLPKALADRLSFGK